jgi:cytochrome b561
MSFVTTAYSVTASYFHWFAAIPMIGCVGTVLKAQQAPKEDKPGLMNLHKSLGLLTGMIVAPRVAYRIFNRAAVSQKKII